ncbi:hypothetical protein CEXT_138761 [Caerostris extrusa]|uniref:Uncharacterized protein n=1 Tax=Caerostris extrusa TaxID=172846 RepID=A0AAV4R5U3_CAEEX|nr:hypothetical protein CEXT_138761 [Caerostris extrusa]
MGDCLVAQSMCSCNVLLVVCVDGVSLVVCIHAVFCSWYVFMQCIARGMCSCCVPYGMYSCSVLLLVCAHASVLLLVCAHECSAHALVFAHAKYCSRYVLMHSIARGMCSCSVLFVVCVHIRGICSSKHEHFQTFFVNFFFLFLHVTFKDACHTVYRGV